MRYLPYHIIVQLPFVLWGATIILLLLLLCSVSRIILLISVSLNSTSYVFVYTNNVTTAWIKLSKSAVLYMLPALCIQTVCAW